MALAELIQDYLNDARYQNFTPSTIKNKKNFCGRLLQSLNGRELTLETARAFLESLSRRSTLTIHTEAVSLKAFINFLFKRKVILTNFAQEISLPKLHTRPYTLVPIETAEKIILSGTEAQQWYNKIAKDKNKIMRTAMLFILHTGLRISEIKKLRSEDFNLDAAPPQFIVHSKGGNSDVLPLDHTAVELIRPFMCNDHLFPVNDDTCNAALERGRRLMQVDTHITCHSLRHIYANDLNAQSAAPQKIQRLMRHQKFATTDKYYLHNDVRDLANVANSYNSLARRNLSDDKKLELLSSEIHRLGLDSDPSFVFQRNTSGVTVKKIKVIR